MKRCRWLPLRGLLPAGATRIDDVREKVRFPFEAFIDCGGDRVKVR
jgi:hypothetical protein